MPKDQLVDWSADNEALSTEKSVPVTTVTMAPEVTIEGSKAMIATPDSECGAA